MPRSRNFERVHMLTFALFRLVLVAGSSPRATGDGGECLAMAFDLAVPANRPVVLIVLRRVPD